MPRILFSLVVVFGSFLQPAFASDTTYTKQWKDIDSTIFVRSLTRTALTKVNSLYQLAKKQNKPAQVIKALLYRMHLEQGIKENNINLDLSLLKKELAETADPVVKSILASIVAQKYQQYYERQRYRIYNRTNTGAFREDDVATWTIEDLHKEITRRYQASLQPKQALQQQAIQRYDAILNDYNTKLYRPTVYDLLAHHALQYFSNDNTYLTRPAYTFIIDQPAALGNINTFLAQTFMSKDTASNHWKALMIYQDLIRFHQQQSNEAALIHVNIERLNFARSKAVLAGKDSLYFASLQEMANRFKGDRHAAEVVYMLANFHAEKAARYSQNKNDSSARFEYLEAVEIILPFLPLRDSTIGHHQLFNLYQTITAKELRLQAEEVNVPGQPFRLLVNFRNVDTLYYRIIRATRSLKDSIGKYPLYQTRNTKSLYQVARDLPYLSQAKIALPNPHDHQLHAVEIKVDALKSGEYYILASVTPTFSDTAQLAWQHVKVSDISFVRNGQSMFVLHRTSGKPLANARVQVFENEYSRSERSYMNAKKEAYTTDRNGYVKLNVSKQGSRNMQLAITYNGETLYSDPNMYVHPLVYHRNSNDDDYDDDEEYEEDNARIFYFTDRSIYRPGQKVYFKMIMLTKDRKTGDSKLYFPAKDDPTQIFLYDANDKKVDSLPVSLNEFGSFAGHFTLPTTSLTGEFSLQNDNVYEETGGEFSVEEYKRPTFEVVFEKPTQEYKLLDSITITGTAKAYAGNTADGAVVKYTVTRRGRFLYPWRYRGIYPVSQEMSITHGEATTGAAGKFTITFPLLPDEQINKQVLPVFDFEIAADVTSNSGETRSGKLVVSAGYHSLNVQLNVKATEDVDSLKHVYVNTTNVGGEKLAATVKVSIIPLQSPKELLRKKYWPQPDTTLYTREQYKQWFPNDEYSNESDKTTWPREVAVFTGTVDTKDSNRITVPKGLLRAGWYVVQAITIDKQGNEIKDERYIQLYSQKGGGFHGNDYLFTSVINNMVLPGEAATFLVGSSAADVFLIQEVQQKPVGKKTEIDTDYSFHNINKNVKTIQVKPGREGEAITVNFIMVKDNRVYTWNQRVLPRSQPSGIQVEVFSYRNKLEPGANETWTVKVSGVNKDAVAAEVLASMYDASLDQFKPHGWRIPALQTEDFYGGSWYQQEGFKAEYAAVNYIERPLKNVSLIYPTIPLNIVSNARYLVAREESMRTTVELQGRAAGVVANAPPAAADEVVVVGYGSQKQANLTGSSTKITVRGTSSIDGTNNPLVIVDGVVVSGTDEVNPDDIASMNVITGAEATALYGARAANGVIVITTKAGAEKLQAEEPLKVRTNFNETAFFFPQLRTDAEGNVSFTFTMPEALTQWKWQVLAHSKQAGFASLERTIVTQKTLMVQTNVPRFLRQGDKVELSARISNLSENELKGTATLQLFDATTGEAIDQEFTNTSSVKDFTVPSKESGAVKFAISIPQQFTGAVTWRVVAKAANFSDGEENTIPVLSNRMLVTETLPFLIRGTGSKTIEMPKLLNNRSATLQHHSLTVEYTAEPVWYAIQSLPYLINYPYECSEQIFNRLFANALAAKIVERHPRIEQVFDQWMKIDTTTGVASGKALLNLQRNPELKNILLEETPWVLEAESEEQQQKNLAVLFDVVQMSKAFSTNIKKLEEMQMKSGGFPWFKGGREDRYITQYILTGIGRLRKMNAVPASIQKDLDRITRDALDFVDAAYARDFERQEKQKVQARDMQVSTLEIQYLYMRSMFNKSVYPIRDNKAIASYSRLAKEQWNKQTTYFKAMIGAAFYNTGDKKFAEQTIVPALLENAVIDNDSAMYWKDMNRGYYWYQAPVEQQVLIMELVNDVYNGNKSAALLRRINDMKTWLLKHKQTNHWDNTKSTADACYALVLTGSGMSSQTRQTTIKVGDHNISTTRNAVAGAGYIKEKIAGDEVQPSMGKLVITTTGTNLSSTPSWGAMYWQYFEDMDKITPAATPLSVEKRLFIEINTATGKELRQVQNGEQLSVGDKLKVRIILRSDRDMEYIHLKDMRAAGSEPVNVLSSYKWQDGLGYYESTRDAATNFFIDRLPKGTYVFEYPLFISHSGNFSVGIATAQCMYAPEFSSHSEGIRVMVK